MWRRIVGMPLVGLAGLLFWIQSGEITLQYLFFLRVPLLIGALLLGLPFIAVFLVPNLLANLFVLRNQRQLRLVTIATIFASIGVVSIYNILLIDGPARFGLQGWQPFTELWQNVIVIALLALPTLFAVSVLSKEEITYLLEKNSPNGTHQGAVKELVIGIGSGILSVIPLLFIGRIATNWPVAWLNSISQFASIALINFPEGIIKGYISNDPEIIENHLSIVIFLACVSFVYGLFYILGYRRYQVALPLQTENIKNRKQLFEVPALFYLLIILLFLVLVLSGLTFFLDYFRVPLIPIFLSISAFNYWFFKVNHFYELKPTQSTAFSKSTFEEILNHRLSNQPSNNRSLVVICAAGGGIQAAGWTAQVLTGLHQHKSLGQEFTDAIGLISSVSGGSVGTMYFLDSFENGQPQHPVQTVENAMQDGLDAIGWGLAYPDFWRIIGLPFLAPLLGARKIDRGTALETDWRGALTHPSTSFATRSEQINQGKLPISVLNATVVDDGSRFLISPVSFKPASSTQQPPEVNPTQPDYTDTRFRDFRTDFATFDINIATAARLSATFPYISPVCRPYVSSPFLLDKLWAKAMQYVSSSPQAQPDLLEHHYHVADGGYFENNGVFTAVEWLDNCILPHASTMGIKQVFFLEILPFPKTEPAEQKTKPGWTMATLGPLLAAFKVRNYTQTARNTVDIGDLKKLWEGKDGFKGIEHFIIQFPKLPELEEKNRLKTLFNKAINNPTPDRQRPSFFNREGEYTPPLSWKLTEKQKQYIREAWNAVAESDEIKRLEKAWKNRHHLG